uniref:glutathione transferase n=1 Tax=Prymnesium polylepis TaxID=72548 RepID=A0A6V3YXP7_9EUKA
MGGGGSAMSDCPTLGYHKIRGLAAAPRMMFFYKGQQFKNKAYANDMKEAWHGGEKPVLKQQNSLINLPYLQDGDVLVTQSNSVLLYLGKTLGIDKDDCWVHNHQVIDQTMDLRNDLMKIVYPFGAVKTPEQLPEGFKGHLEGSGTTNFTKLEGFCKGPYMCGAAPQSGDFHVFEMLDQHLVMVAELGLTFDTASFPKLMALHAKMKAEPSLAKYFDHAMYKSYPFNNALFTTFKGPGYDGNYDPVTEVVTM